MPGLGGVCSGGCVPGPGGVSALGGVPGLGGVVVSARGVCSRGVPGRGGCLLRGGIPACTEADTPPLWTEFLTHACENITLAQLRCGR